MFLININGYLSLASTWIAPHTWRSRILQLLFPPTDNPAQVFFAPKIIRFGLCPTTWSLIGCMSVRSISQSDRLMGWLCRRQQIVSFAAIYANAYLTHQQMHICILCKKSVSPLASSGQRSRASWASQPQKSATLWRETTKVHKNMWLHWREREREKKTYYILCISWIIKCLMKTIHFKKKPELTNSESGVLKITVS